MEMNVEDSAKLKQLCEKIAELQKEARRLDNTSYSQSDPSAMMERRDNRRYLAKAEREYEALLEKYRK
jgi:hypothetical protein